MPPTNSSGKGIERFLAKSLEWWVTNAEVIRITVIMRLINQYDLPKILEDSSEIPIFNNIEKGSTT
jgi:hypothetical protein